MIVINILFYRHRVQNEFLHVKSMDVVNLAWIHFFCIGMDTHSLSYYNYFCPNQINNVHKTSSCLDYHIFHKSNSIN